MRRQPLVVALVGLALAACLERARPGIQQSPGNDGTPSEPEGQIPDVTRDTGVFLRTAALRYQLRRESSGYAVDIPYTYTNPRKRAVYLAACLADEVPSPPAMEQELLPGKWVRAWSPDTRACRRAFYRPLELGAGQVVSDTLHLRAAFATDSITAFTVDPIQGVYRLVWYTLASFDTAVAGYGPVLPVTERLSNRFVLDKP